MSQAYGAASQDLSQADFGSVSMGTVGASGTDGVGYGAPVGNSQADGLLSQDSTYQGFYLSGAGPSQGPQFSQVSLEMKDKS
jgi:hypothetical protein